MVKAADLEEWGLTPLTSAQLAEFAETAYTEDIIQVPSKRDLVQIASEELGFNN
jgi:hypothetical protein